MPDVSFCFYGQVKNYNEELLNSFIENIFDPACCFYKPDRVFKYLVSYDNRFIFNSRNDENFPINFYSIFDYLNFDKYKIFNVDSRETKNIDDLAEESVERYGNDWGKTKTESILSVKYAIRQLYCLSELQCLTKPNNINIILRPDVKFLNKLKLDSSSFDLYVPSFNSFDDFCNDRFCICLNSRSFDVYCGRLDNFLKLDETYNSEHFLMNQIKRNNISLGFLDIKFVRVRANGQVEARDEYLL